MAGFILDSLISTLLANIHCFTQLDTFVMRVELTNLFSALIVAQRKKLAYPSPLSHNSFPERLGQSFSLDTLNGFF